jgi:hypothetical protein
MKHLGLYSILISLAVLGMGCPLAPPEATPQIAEPIEQVLPARPIAQVRGFGEIPKVPSPKLRPGTKGSVQVNALLPEIPTTVTVLRIKSGNPAPAELRNLGAAFNIPGETIGVAPQTQTLTLQWIDDQNTHWTFTGAERNFVFTNPTKTIKTNPVAQWMTSNQLIDAARSFLTVKGVNLRHLGPPYLEPDWNAWWKNEQELNHCMDQAARAVVRTVSASTVLLHAAPPSLPAAKNAHCVTPEFPSRAVVQFNATQDAQGIFNSDGSSIKGATLYLNALTGEVLFGSFTQPADPERSDYPGLALEEAELKLAQGGQGGTPNGDVTIDAVTFEWFKIEDQVDTTTAYLYPALVGTGTITYPDKTTAPYRIIVPLVK